jgi:predicted peptidase
MNEQQFTQGPGYQHIVFSPQDPYASEKQWPLIVFLHGVDERGNNLDLVKRQGLPLMLQHRQTFPFVTAVPQCPDNEYWLPSLVEELIPVVGENYKIAEDRVYLTGISMGGYGTWMAAINFPDRFAAIAPICGGGDPDRASLIRHIPVWTFHGAKDPVVPVSETEAMVDALKKVQADVKFTKYPEGGHDVWTGTYDDEALYTWFLSHNRRSRAELRKAS